MAQTSSTTKLVLSLIFVANLSACISSPSTIFQRNSEAFGFYQSSIKTDLFELSFFDNQRPQINGELHVYLDGDGSPFIQTRFVNSDPTSRKTTTLSMMSQDQTHSILVGRPCYHGKQSDICKESKWWTSHRYSPEVVKAMTQAINKLNERNLPVTLIGFSGGGTLAMLMADDVNHVQEIITISANLDIDAWTDFHAYSPLSGSLNPIKLPSKTKHIKQRHLIGERDTNIPHSRWADKLKGKNSEVIKYPTFTHHCCWSSIWPQVLKMLNE